MVDIYLFMIKTGKMTVEKVPPIWKSKVEEKLK